MNISVSLPQWRLKAAVKITFLLQFQPVIIKCAEIYYCGPMKTDFSALFPQKEGKTFFLKCSTFLLLCCQQDRLQNMRQPAHSYIKYQVHRVHMQNRVFTHCRSKTQLGYHCVPLSEVLYQSQYLVSCVNGCCVEPSNSTGAGKRVDAKQKSLHWLLQSRNLPAEVKGLWQTCISKWRYCTSVWRGSSQLKSAEQRW